MGGFSAQLTLLSLLLRNHLGSGITIPLDKTFHGIATAPPGKLATLYAVGDGGAIVRSNGDLDTIWVESDESTYKYDLKDIACPTAKECYAVGVSGHVLYTNKADASNQDWSNTASGTATTKDLYGVSFPNTGVGYAVGDGGVIIKCNGGTGINKWALQTSPTSSNLRGVHCHSTNSCFAVGVGVILSMKAAGAWTVVTPAASLGSVTLNAVGCSSDTRCIAVGDAGKAFGSTDGTSWAPMNLDSSTTSLQTVVFAYNSGMVAIIAGLAGDVLWSSDAHKTAPNWSLVDKYTYICPDKKCPDIYASVYPIYNDKAWYTGAPVNNNGFVQGLHLPIPGKVTSSPTGPPTTPPSGHSPSAAPTCGSGGGGGGGGGLMIGLIVESAIIGLALFGGGGYFVYTKYYKNRKATINSKFGQSASANLLGESRDSSLPEDPNEAL